MRVTILDCILSFADTIRIAKPFRGKPPRHSANAIMTDTTKLVVTRDDGTTATLAPSDFEKVINKLCTDKWGERPAKLKNWAYNRADGSGTRDVYINKDGDYYAGYDADTWYFVANKFEEDVPEGLPIVDANREPLPATSGHPRSGDRVNMVIEVFCFEAENDKGITATLEGIQFLRKDKSFSNKAPLDPKSAFPVEEMVDDVQPAAGSDSVGDMF